MEVQEYVSKMRKIHSLFLEFLDCSDNEQGENFRVFIEYDKYANILEDSDEIYEILVLISKVSKNHYRYPNFFDKIEIYYIFTEKIKQSFTNFQIFNIFKSNKRILLILFNNKIIEIDSSILDFILNSEKEKYKSYKFYFFNEIKEIISENTKESIECDLIMYDLNVFNNFHEKCLIGENESYICSLIRNDSIEEFNQNNISLSNSIKPSIFETNSLLINSKENQTIKEEENVKMMNRLKKQMKKLNQKILIMIFNLYIYINLYIILTKLINYRWWKKSVGVRDGQRDRDLEIS